MAEALTQAAGKVYARRVTDSLYVPSWARKIAGWLLPPAPMLRQGNHPDPLDPATPPPRRQDRPRAELEVLDSTEMEWFRDSLLMPGLPGVRAAIIDDLSSYSGLTPEECVRRCLDWESWSVEEWVAADRSSEAGLRDFYLTTQSWAFDLMWYAYLQAEGYVISASVQALRAIPGSGQGRDHLDFGSGAGFTSQLFARAGYQVTLADVSTPLLDFARHRLSRRGEAAKYIDLNDEQLDLGRYDVITALDALTQVPDLADVAASLHRALRPGGWLITNFDVRPPSPENAWHLYEDDLDLRAVMQRAGFMPRGHFGSFILYRRREPSGMVWRLRRLYDRVFLISRPRRLARRSRQRLAIALRRIAPASSGPSGS
jgi:SAM-dependent methyltransferase